MDMDYDTKLVDSTLGTTGVGIHQYEEVVFATCGTCQCSIYWDREVERWYCSGRGCGVIFPRVTSTVGSSSRKVEATPSGVSSLHYWVASWLGLDQGDIQVAVKD